jgi:hypothetical protein
MVDRKKHSTEPSAGVPSSTSQAAQAEERRMYCRFPFTAEATVVELSSQTQVIGRSSDLGSGGCYIDTMSTLPVGTGVRLQLKHEQRIFEALAIVSYAHHSLGMGLAFVAIEPNHRMLLDQWITLLTGGPAEQIPESTPATTQCAGPPPVGVQPGTHEMEALSQVFKMRQVLSELIGLMVRKRLIDQKEAANLLQQIFR